MSAVTDEMVEAALPSYSEGGCSGLDEQERREVVRDILEAGFALLPAQTEPDAGRVEGLKPVAWQWRHYYNTGGEWMYCPDGFRPFRDADGAEYRALYALPTPPSTPREEIEHQGVVAVGVKG